MLVSTGRTASRAFFINLRTQDSLVLPNRYSFDSVVTDFIKNDSHESLKNLISELEVEEETKRKRAIVAHGALNTNQLSDPKLLSQKIIDRMSQI